MRNKIVWLVSKMIMRTFLVLEMFLLWNCLGGAADFKGATEVLQLASESPAKPKQNGDDPNAVFRQKIKAFGSSSTNLTSAEAAKQWLTLVEDFQSELAKSAVEAQIPRREGLGLRFEEIMDVLPPPAYWADLEKAVESRSSAVAK